jgi:D-glycero-D-manno-heptose 1,7-bisphosphate phosphatase
MNRAVFLDRDGVLVEDVDVVTHGDDLRLLPGVPMALNRLRDHGFKLVVVTNQPIVARGLVTERDVATIHEFLASLIRDAGGPLLECFYFCPHHPKATLPAYRQDCDCRKPRAGLLRRAAIELGIDLSASYLVGDRITDVIAGASVGCRTVLVQTGKHLAPPITTSEPIDPNIEPDHRCDDLATAVDWILGGGKPEHGERYAS